MSGPSSPAAKQPGSPKHIKSVSSGIAVMIRCRPFNQREKHWFAEQGKEVTPVLSMEGDRVNILDPANDYQPKDAFAYNHCYWSCVGFDSPNGIATQDHVYQTSGKQILEKALEGYNGTVFAYGQTGAGKTYSMLGAPGSPGISYLAINDLFAHIEREKVDNPGTMYTVEISFMEIYNEQVRDLFNKNIKAGQYSPVKIRQHPVLGIQVEGLQRLKVESATECEKTMERGVNERTLAETKMNATSSRSHAICQISILQTNAKTGLRRNSSINLVDLAGSERLKMTGAQGQQLKEAQNINQSLSTLRKVFDVLIDNSKKGKKNVPPYRESMLTWVLKESLGGNSQTTMIAAVSPCEESIEDTISTLRYAQKAKAVVNKVIQNEQPNAKMVLTLKNQVEELQRQLAERLAGGASARPDSPTFEGANNGGAGGPLSEEEKERLKQEYEDQIAATQSALKDAEGVESQMKAKQAELESKVMELEVAHGGSKFDLDQQRRRNFAAVFRNAFKLKEKDKTIKVMQERSASLSVMPNGRDVVEYEKEIERYKVQQEALEHRIDVLARENSGSGRKYLYALIIVTVVLLSAIIVLSVLYAVQ